MPAPVPMNPVPINPTPATPAQVATMPAQVIPQSEDADALAGSPPTILPSAAAKGGLGHAFMKGMIWSTLALIISKFSSLLATIGLAWVFGEREYGSFASARGSSMIGDVLTDGGMGRVLITRGRTEYDRVARTAFRVSLAFNLTGCLLMCGSATFIYQPGVAPQVVVTGLAMLIATFGSVQRARLATDLRFARSAFMYTVSAVLRNVLMVAFAFGGLGPLSFALPVVFVAVWEACYARIVVGPLPPIPSDVKPSSLARELIGQGKWVIFAMIGSSLVARGDYLIATSVLHQFDVVGPDGKTNTIDIAGQYMFAFQLCVNLFSPLTLALATVIQPVMAQLRTDPTRQADAFRRMVRVTVFLATPVALISIGVTPCLIHLIRHGYWDTTATAIQILAASECVRQLYYMSTATLEASGHFKRSAIVVGIDGLLTVLAALIGCLVGKSLLSLTIAIATQRTLTAIAEAIYTDRLAGGSLPKMLRTILPPLLVGGAIALGLGVAVHLLARDVATHRWLTGLAGLLALPAFFVASMLATPGRVREARELLGTRLKRRR